MHEFCICKKNAPAGWDFWFKNVFDCTICHNLTMQHPFTYQMHMGKQFPGARRLLPVDMLERWPHVCRKITFTFLLTNCFVSTQWVRWNALYTRFHWESMFVWDIPNPTLKSFKGLYNLKTIGNSNWCFILFPCSFSSCLSFIFIFIHDILFYF